MDGFPPNVPTFGSTIDNSSGGGSCYHDIDDASFESSWTLSTILTLARESGGLSEISADRLQKCLEPVVARLQQIDAEALLQLKQVESGGARLRDG